MEKLKKLFLDFISTYGYAESDLTREGGYSGTIGEYAFLKTIFKVYRHICSGNFEKGVLQFKDSLDEIDFTFDVSNSTDEEFEKAVLRRDIVKQVSELKDDVEKRVYEPLIEIVNNHDFFKGEEIDREKVPSDIILNVSDWMEKDHLKKYVLKQGNSEIPKEPINFKVSTDLYLSNNINYFVDNFNKEYNDDVARVTVFFKIEKCVEYSYFMFVINYKDHVIAYSDLPLTPNPHMCGASRNPRRKMENKHCYCWLPYTLIDELDDIRKDSTTIAKTENDVEFHKLNWKRFGQPQRMYTLLVIRNLIENLSEGEGKLLVSAQKYYNQKLLEGDKIEVDEWSDNDETFTNWKESNKENVKEIIDNMVENSDSKELMKTSYDIVVKNDLYDESMLAPIELHESHAKWIAVTNYANNIQKEVGKRLYMYGSHSIDDEKPRKEAREKLSSMLDNNLEAILKKLLISDELLFVTNDSKYGTFSSDKEDVLLNFEFKERKKDDYFDLPSFSLGSKYGWSFVTKEEEECPIIPKYKGSTEYSFKIRHYSQLMYLLDCKREDLPRYFRCYKTHYMVPYKGNSILNNTHPLNKVYDPASSMNPNGILIRVMISKRGRNKIVKELGGKDRPDILAVDINGKTYDNIDKKSQSLTVEVSS